MKPFFTKKIITALVLAGSGTYAAAQDVHSSQFYEQAALRNPALTGIHSGDYKGGINYRSQGSGFGVPFITAVASAETKMLIRSEAGDYLSFGLTTVYDKAGSIDFVSTSAYGAINYNKALADEQRSYLSVGLSGGFIQRSMDVHKLRFANQYVAGSYNPGNTSGEQLGLKKIGHFDVAAGVSLNSSLGSRVNYYLGVAAYHLSEPRETYFSDDFIRLTTRWSGNFGLRAAMGNHVILTVHANYQYQDPYQEIIGGGLLGYAFTRPLDGQKVVFSAGCFYRYADAIIPTIKLEYNQWSVSASYDVPLAGRRMYNGGLGGYEISVYGRGRYRRQEEVLSCPRFELLDRQEELYR